ncbi:MAG TPA: hypothetical protein VNZ64_12895 [Candidatus Acidoferrum sp.]|jgi:hypothetical protein|nr:hypothetical protein [Candidatus Acidoferrum sp.]
MRETLLWFLMGACMACQATAGELATNQTAAARKLYLNRCAKCHKLYDPSKYSDEKWRTWMEKMSRKARLQPQQQEAVSSYIETALRRPTPTTTGSTVP